ncbi:MAG: M23 family metallopeptidase [Chitinophagaceae bacterium]|nr:M23 family metallopeptidase [Chitinophagaceae bacterium]
MILTTACTVSQHPMREKVKRLQKGLLRDDTSYVYALPYLPGKRYKVIQGYFSRFTHRNRAALDFNLKKGDTICAAREGVVVRVKEDGKRGGLNRKYRPQGNYIVIEHADGSRSGYWHLQYQGAFVQPGDSVKKGQAIGLSGKTGYALMPHLHFLVWKFEQGRWHPVPTRFLTSKGIRFLKTWKKYKRPAE